MSEYTSPEQVLQSWIENINSGDVNAVSAMYSDEAVLLPTFSNRRLTTPADRLGYFVRIGSKPSLSVELHKRTVVFQKLSESIHSICGIYLWKFEDEEELLSFEARFTYTVDLRRDKPIVHHHSSQIPRML